MNYAEIKKEAASKWQKMQASEQPRILIGTGTCGAAAGADEILGTLRRELEANGLKADIIQVAVSACATPSP